MLQKLFKEKCPDRAQFHSREKNNDRSLHAEEWFDSHFEWIFRIKETNWINFLFVFRSDTLFTVQPKCDLFMIFSQVRNAIKSAKAILQKQGECKFVESRSNTAFVLYFAFYLRSLVLGFFHYQICYLHC